MGLHQSHEYATFILGRLKDPLRHPSVQSTMLELRQALGGKPNNSNSGYAVSHLVAAGSTYAIYPSSDSVIVCDADLNLSCALSFAAAIPGRASSSTSAVAGVLCDPQHGFIIAWREQHVVFWQHKSGTGLEAWKPWSSLVASSTVTSVDFKDGDLLLGMKDGLEMWHVDLTADIDVWDRRWIRPCATPVRVCISPATEHVAWMSSEHTNVVNILTINKLVPRGLPQEVKHPRTVEWIGWRKPRDRRGGDVHLYTISNSVLRVYAPVLDDPTWFQLHTSVDGRSGGKRGTLLVLDADELRQGDHDGHELAEDDMFLCIGVDGTLTVRAILNMDRKPPTLLKIVPIATVANEIEPHVAALTTPDCKLANLLDKRMLLLIPGAALASYIVDPSKLFSSKQNCLEASTVPRKPGGIDGPPRVVQMSDGIQRFYRTPNGRGLLAMGETEVGVWEKRPLGREKGKGKALVGKGHWTTKGNRLMAIYAKGRGIVSYTSDPSRISLQHLHRHRMDPSPPVSLPDFDCQDEIVLLLAVSDIDDGLSGADRKTDRAYVIAASAKAEVWLWRVVSAIQPDEHSEEPPTITLVSHYKLPIDTVDHVLPVDPMGWHQSVIDWANDAPLQDIMMTVSGGHLEFWKPHLGADSPSRRSEQAWSRSGMIKTDKTGVTIARCSSRKKTALATKLQNGYELSIWDSKASDFSSGLEYTQVFDDDIQDLDWTTTSDLQSVLAVGTPHKVVLICEERMFYIGNTPGWAAFLTIDISDYTADPIADSIWLAGGSLAVGAGNQVLLYSRFLEKSSTASPADEAEDIFQLIAQRNGPVVDFHPAMLGQCLLWDKMDIVKRILSTLTQSLKDAEASGSDHIRYERLDASVYYESKIEASRGLFASGLPSDAGLYQFDDKALQDLQALLNGNIKLPLSTSERSALSKLAQAIHDIDKDRRALDTNALRYIFAVRMLVNSGVDTELISARNLVWALHSESQEAMLRAASESCGERMMWPDAKRLGVFQWLKAPQLAAQMDLVARNTFLADDRDPTGCSLFYFVLGKKRIVHGLWRQAAGHSEQQAMLRFLANDFDQPRWKTAANKNAYALLSKQRFAYAAAFFMLAGSHRDCINVCLRQLRDVPLAIAIARVIEGDDGPLLRWILTDTVVPLAFAGGHRWLGSWAFWMLGRRDLSIRMLISPLKDVAKAYDATLPVGESENDDPSLGLLYQQLKGKTLQTAKGTSEITQKTEFNFVLHNARVFCRMGCHPLALALVRSWSFDRPILPTKRPNPMRSPTIRRQSFLLAAGDTPRKSMIMDMDIIESRSQSPEPLETKPKVASLMKAAEPASSQGGQEFDMGSFGSTPEPSKLKVASLMKTSAPSTSQGGAEFDMGSFAFSEPAKPKVASLMKASVPSASSQGGMEFNMGSFGAPSEPSQPKLASLIKNGVSSVDQGAQDFDMGSFGEPSAQPDRKAPPKDEEPAKPKVASLMKAAEPQVQASQGAMEFDFSAFG